MMHSWRKRILSAFLILLAAAAALAVLSYRPAIETITYGSSFNTLYARELGLEWQEVYLAMLDDLGVRHLRLAAHWPMVEPERGAFNFEELDFQIAEAEERAADVILGVGRRLPRWPECHVPAWAQELSWEEQQKEIREFITAVVERYRDRAAVSFWQVENEPFLGLFASDQCGDLDVAFLDEEIELVKRLDPSRPVLITDSGNLGLWAPAYRRGDAFGTSVYLYFWNEDIGPYRSVLPAAFYRLKYNLMRVIYGARPAFLIELSAEPWLLQPVVDTPIATQLERMNLATFEEILAFAARTGFDRQYLWGAEWWYWLRERGEPGFWNTAKELFPQNAP